jgi:tricorn protease
VLSPDGKTIAQIARGEVFVRSTDENWPTRRVTFTPGRERELAWSPDGRVLWFSSDQGGTSAIHYATVTLSREDLEDKPKADEKKDETKADKPEGDAKPAEPKAEADAKSEPSDAADKKDAPGASRPAKDAKEKKPDWGKRWAEGLKFEVKPLDLSFVPKGPHDGRNDGVLGMELRSPTPSPDGRKLLVIRGLGDMVLVDLVAKSARTLVNSWSEPEARWAADSRHIVYANEDLDFNSDIFLLDTQPDAQGSVTPVNLTRHPDLDTSPRLTSDGKVLYFRSERAGENFDFGVYAVFLDRKLEGLRPYELEDYFKKASTAAKARKPIDAVLWDDSAWLEKDRAAQAKAEAKADAKKPGALSFDADDAWKRVRRISVGAQGVGALESTHAGDRLVISQGAELPGAESTLSSVNYKGEDRKAITSGSVRAVSMAGSGGERVVFLRSAGASGAGGGGGGGGATASAAPVGGGKVDAYAIDAPVTIDIAKQQRQKFTEASRIMGNGFYHPTLKGLNWPALTQRYASLAERTVTNEEFDRVFTMMLGELDGSHTGINGPGAFSPPSLGMGYLGVDGRTTDAGFVIQRVLEGGPADRLAAKLAPGDTITHVDGEPAAGVEFANTMVSKAGREVVLTVLRAGQAEAKPLLITPGSAGDDTQLRYNAEVQRRRELVDRFSNGRLGYLHIRGMSEPSVRDFERDLFAAAHGKDGLLIDVRDNGGGSTADILLASLTAPRHAKTQPRGVLPGEVPADAYPRDRRLIYAYSRPLSVLINENSFSNAEIFAHAIRTTRRGTVVGTATYGGVISTGSASLIDGTTIRTPFRGWYLPDGTDMENNGARPDLAVEQVPVDEATERDAQLEAAVTELLGRIGK